MLTKKEIGERIKKYRNQKGLSQAQLGQALGRSYATISDIENGKTDISASDISVIANSLGIPVEELLKNDSPTISYVQSRDSKNATPEDKKELDQSGEAFRKLVREMAEQEENKNDK